MASVGEIISTAQGLASIVQVLPNNVNLGAQSLSQVVADPLGGGDQLLSPSTGKAAVTQQSDFLTQVLDQTQSQTTASSSSAGTTASQGSAIGATVVNQTYQTSQQLNQQSKAKLVALG